MDSGIRLFPLKNLLFAIIFFCVFRAHRSMSIQSGVTAVRCV